jgi:hypothetical protein
MLPICDRHRFNVVEQVRMVAHFFELHQHIQKPDLFSTIAVNHVKIIGNQIFVPRFLQLTHAYE